MSKKEYSKLLLLNGSEVRRLKKAFKLTECSFTSPPKTPTSPSKKATSPPLRLAKTGGSPGGSRPLTLAFCWGLECVSVQNTHFTSKKGLLGTKKFFRTLSVRLLAGWF
ncbi:hypothetical protein DPV73_01140 [Leptospira mayottensis]|nr:hypothetical protein DPV73_01060 [Leptospira mayottensis]AXR66840.1 hypothetical protein DPV73_01140 [Leptospira mayottensis]